MTQSTTPIALITGGSRGLGRNTAIHLARKGIDVILTWRGNRAEAESAMAEIEALGRRAAILQLDTGDIASFPGFAEAVKSVLAAGWQRDRIDFLVNNAGHGVYKPFAEVTEAEFDGLVNVHFKGVFFLTQTLLPLIRDGGHVVNVSSGLTRITLPGFAAYAAMKAANRAAASTGSLMPPAHILNAPTGLMKDLGYGKDYAYDHDDPDGFAGQNGFPDGMQRQRFYTPVERGYEREIGKRLAYWNRLRAEKSGGGQ